MVLTPKAISRIWIRYEDMLSCDLARQAELKAEFMELPLTFFREKLARIVLNGLGKSAHAHLLPLTKEKGEAFYESVAYNMAYVVEAERPKALADYPDDVLAALLLERFIVAYRVLDLECIPDSELHLVTCMPMLALPSQPTTTAAEVYVRRTVC